MQNIWLIDNQLVADTVVEMWYTKLVNNFRVAVHICIIENPGDVFGNIPRHNKWGSKTSGIYRFLDIIMSISKVAKSWQFAKR